MSLVFNGSTFITILNDPLLQVIGDQTIEMWLKPLNFDTRRNPWNKAYGGEGTMTIELNSRINYIWGTSGANTVPYIATPSPPSPTLTAGSWNHIAVVRDISGDNLVKWYFNGVLVSTGSIIYSSAMASAFDITIGDGYTNPYEGSMYEVRYWNIARSQFDIASNLGNHINPQSGLVGYWKLNEEDSFVANDSSGNNFNGNIILPTWDNDFPFSEPVPVPTFTEINLARTIFHLGYPSLAWSNSIVSQSLNRVTQQNLESQVSQVLDNLDAIYSARQNYVVTKAGIQVDGTTANSYFRSMTMRELNTEYRRSELTLSQMLSIPLQVSTSKSPLIYG